MAVDTKDDILSFAAQRYAEVGLMAIAVDVNI